MRRCGARLKPPYLDCLRKPRRKSSRLSPNQHGESDMSTRTHPRTQPDCWSALELGLSLRVLDAELAALERIISRSSRKRLTHAEEQGLYLVIDTLTNTVTGLPITVGNNPSGVATTPDGSKVYVANSSDGSVSVIATATNTVIGPPARAVNTLRDAVRVGTDSPPSFEMLHV